MVGLGFDSSLGGLGDVWKGRDVWFRSPADAVTDRCPMPSSSCFGLLIFGDGRQHLGLGEIDSSKIVGAIRAAVCRENLSRHGAQVANRGLDSSHRAGTGVV